ncbi:MAG: homocysteine S-methyltransferase family protein [Victivallales bacterium]|nr:homocysteine S-methyltransferase family protein [Victivallales bacterium]
MVLDGATGTELAKRGMSAGVAPEAWVLEHPDAIQAIQQAYESAGSDIVYAPTFGGNRIKLAEYGLADRTREINRDLARISRQGVRKALVFGDIAPTGRFIEPFGDLGFEEAVAVYREQAQALAEGGVDGFAVETMMDLQEARAALLGIRDVSDLPVIVTMTYNPDGHTLSGTPPSSAIVTLQALGADAVGCNCSAGPEQMVALVREMAECARVPIVAKPNAGMPRLVDGRSVFEMGPQTFASLIPALVSAGAGVVGGCCGTTPEHIACLHDAVKNLPVPLSNACSAWVSSVAEALRIGQGRPFAVIGERLNPTGKKALQADLKSGELALVQKLAEEQAQAGAALLDVNCGLPGIDEAATMRRLVAILAKSTRLPLCIDTTNAEVAEAALRLYPGRALFNSISAEKARLTEVLPVVAKYGAMLVALPLKDDGIPATVEGRAECLAAIEEAAARLGYRHEDLVVDGLVMTVSSNPEAAGLTLDTLEWSSRVWKGGSVCGLSNVSFGLPRRDLVNRAFLAMAIGRGLTMAIANPCNADLMETVHSCDVLRGTDPSAKFFIGRYTGTKPAGAGSVSAAPAGQAAKDTAPATPLERVGRAVLNGDVPELRKAIEGALADGLSAKEIVDNALIPAIGEVGQKYERHEFFLPQLMEGAKAMQEGMAQLEPLLAAAAAGQEKAGCMIMATVRHDIHDIGKNIVALMLRNYNFEVIDLGKDVPAERILDTARERNVKVIGLSALMTTTMGEMGKVVELARERGMDDLKFIVGGAVVNEDYASSIGAVYAKDAMDTVRIARRLLEE